MTQLNHRTTSIFKMQKRLQSQDTYHEVPLKAHLSDDHIVSMPDDTTAKLMSEGFYKIDMITDIEGMIMKMLILALCKLMKVG